MFTSGEVNLVWGFCPEMVSVLVLLLSDQREKQNCWGNIYWAKSLLERCSAFLARATSRWNIHSCPLQESPAQASPKQPLPQRNSMYSTSSLNSTLSPEVNFLENNYPVKPELLCKWFDQQQYKSIIFIICYKIIHQAIINPSEVDGRYTEQPCLQKKICCTGIE